MDYKSVYVAGICPTCERAVFNVNLKESVSLDGHLFCNNRCYTEYYQNGKPESYRKWCFRCEYFVQFSPNDPLHNAWYNHMCTKTFIGKNPPKVDKYSPCKLIFGTGECCKYRIPEITRFEMMDME